MIPAQITAKCYKYVSAKQKNKVKKNLFGAIADESLDLWLQTQLDNIEESYTPFAFRFINESIENSAEMPVCNLPSHTGLVP